MRCTRPRTVGFGSDGKTLVWSQKQLNKEYATFQLPCGKCLECRLEYARQWAVRCVHEASMYEKNMFLTLTFDEDHVAEKLDYRDFQLFMKKLRKLQDAPMGMFVTGEYGEKTKRAHWHVLVFNYEPADKKYKYTSKRGDKYYESKTLSELWGKGMVDFSEVTFESAGYVARYAAKKLTHGWDGEHEFEPISKKSSKYAIGKRFIEKFYSDIFNTGKVVLIDGTETSIPRYYERWFKEHHPDKWLKYVERIKLEKMALASEKQAKEIKGWYDNLYRRPPTAKTPLTPNQVKETILRSKFKLLQDNLKF